MRRSSKPVNGGFTLVELLVVIGIISVLISILLPALNVARERARQISCATRLRGISQAVEMMMADHHYLLPGVPYAQNAPTNPVTYSFGSTSVTYTYSARGVNDFIDSVAYVSYGFWNDLRPYGIATAQAGMCPSDQAKWGGNWAAQSWVWPLADVAQIETDSSFGTSYYLPFPLRTSIERKVTSIKFPTQKVLLCESTCLGYPTDDTADFSYFPFQQMCHRTPSSGITTAPGYSQAVFIDGHVEMYNVSQVNGIQPNGANNYYSLDWVGSDITETVDIK